MYALVLTIEELRKFIDKSKTKQQRTSHGMYLYTIRISIEQYLLFVVNMRLTTYLHHTWGFRRCISVVHSKTTILICYLLDYQQVHENTNVSIILLGDKKEPTK